METDVQYSWNPGRFVVNNEKLLEACSVLYSEHYGIWDNNGVKPGQHIKLSSNRLKEWLERDDVLLYCAEAGEQLIGYAIAYSRDETKYGIITWVTQLVVHSDFRNQGIAKSLLFSIWGFSDHFAWGIVSANPYAIRALEKATRRRAVPMRIKKNSRKLMGIGKKNVPFINEETQLLIKKDLSVIDTNFFVDHADTETMLENVTSDAVPWKLGNLNEGWEWFVFTFNDQEQIKLSPEEVQKMIETSESVVKQAYSKMNIQSPSQSWTRNSAGEVEYILKRVCIPAGSTVFDLGCGVGRHSIELAKRGMKVVGIDYIPNNIRKAIKEAERQNLSSSDVIFKEADCRNYMNDMKVPLVICLYDVVGSHAADEDNKRIIENAYSLLKDGGYAVFSVMNIESMKMDNENCFSFKNNADRLLDILPSDRMEKTGEVFNPKYCLLDKDTRLVYRKEQFHVQNELPVELIVRDRRFTMDEVNTLCKSVGFRILESKYTNASGWEKEYSATSKRAKEILLICQK